MMAEERRQKILSLLQSDGRVLVTNLSKVFNVSQITIRKDLDSLHGRGLVQRSHGGALPPSSSTLFDPSLQEKQQLHTEEKQRIAAAAAKMVQEGSCVMLDSGTTTAAIAQALKKFSALTVITKFGFTEREIPRLHEVQEVDRQQPGGNGRADGRPREPAGQQVQHRHRRRAADGRRHPPPELVVAERPDAERGQPLRQRRVHGAGLSRDAAGGGRVVEEPARILGVVGLVEHQPLWRAQMEPPQDAGHQRHRGDREPVASRPA